MPRDEYDDDRGVRHVVHHYEKSGGVAALLGSSMRVKARRSAVDGMEHLSKRDGYWRGCPILIDDDAVRQEENVRVVGVPP